VVIPSGEVGSIGVFCAHEDISKAAEQAGVKVSLISAGKYKTEGNEFEPLSDDARADLQSKVDAFYGMFIKAVGRGRRASQENVRNGFGQGRMVLAADAVKEGMADRVATMDDTLARLGGATGSTSQMAASGPGEQLRADDGVDPLQEKDCICGCEACRAGACVNCMIPNCTDPGCDHKQAAKSAVARRRRERGLL
jgi:ClpP class serine protease